MSGTFRTDSLRPDTDSRLVVELAAECHAAVRRAEAADAEVARLRAQMAEWREQLESFANANPRKWDPPASDDEAMEWVRSRARHVLGQARATEAQGGAA